MSSTAGAVIGAIVGVGALIFLIVAFFKSILTVREKEQVILERCGRFKAVLTPGMHCILPFIDRPKRFSARYYLETPTGAVQLVEKLNQTRVLTQDEIMDLPKQACIVSTRASARAATAVATLKAQACPSGCGLRSVPSDAAHPFPSPSTAPRCRRSLLCSAPADPRQRVHLPGRAPELQDREPAPVPVPQPEPAAHDEQGAAGAGARRGGVPGRGLHH